MKRIAIILNVLIFIVSSCEQATKKQEENANDKDQLKNKLQNVSQSLADTIILSKKHIPNSILCDLDGDGLSDTVKIVLNTRNGKYGLKITFGNKTVKYLGMGKEILGQGFDDINWVGLFEKAPKGKIYWNNVNDDGEIISEEDIRETDKIKLPNDGIFIHEAESCGGGVIYLNNGEFKWIQQE